MNTQILSFDKKSLDNLLDHVLISENNKSPLICSVDTNNIILYGAGNLGIMAINLLKKAGIRPKYIIDKCSARWDETVDNIKIVSPEDISNDDKINAIFAICIVNFPFTDVKGYLSEIGCKNIVPFWDIAEYFKDKIKVTNGWYCKKLDEIDRRDIKNIYKNLCDNISRASYIQVLYWRIKRQEILFQDAEIIIEDKFFPKGIMPQLTQNEFFVDCGSYNGNTIERFMEYVDNKFQHIVAFEPDPKNYEQLCKVIDNIEETTNKKITAYQYGVGNIEQEKNFVINLDLAGRFDDNSNGIKVKIVTLDNILKNNPITLLKIHVEGDEYKVLQGSLQVINKNRPIIIVTTYHSEEGLWKVPKLLMENLNDYCYYHRLHGYCGNESVLYAFPKERIL